jgi:hypothetical protein
MALYRCVAYGVYASGRPWSFRQNFSSAATVTAVQADWHAQINSAWTNGSHGLETLYPTTTSLNLTRTYALFLTLGPPIKVKAGSAAQNTEALPGTSANDGLPDQDAVVVSLRTAGVGVNNRGRTFLPAIDETVVTGDVIGSTPATRVSTAMAALRTGMASAGHVQVIFNDKPTVLDPVTATTKAILLCETDRVVRSQRRRIRKEVAQYV